MIGSVEGQLNTPYGPWYILDPVLVWGGLTPVTGQVEAVIPIPDDPGLRGVKLLAQGFVEWKLTQLARVTFRLHLALREEGGRRERGE